MKYRIRISCDDYYHKDGLGNSEKNNPMKNLILVAIIMVTAMFTAPTMAQSKEEKAKAAAATTALAQAVQAQQAKQAETDQALTDLNKKLTETAEQNAGYQMEANAASERMERNIERLLAAQSAAPAPATATVATANQKSATLPADTTTKVVKVKKVNPWAYLGKNVLLDVKNNKAHYLKSAWKADSMAITAAIPAGFEPEVHKK